MLKFWFVGILWYRFGSSFFDDIVFLFWLKREGILCVLVDVYWFIDCVVKDLKIYVKNKEGFFIVILKEGFSLVLFKLRVKYEKKGYLKCCSLNFRRLWMV